jgi:iron complex transport system ATP-binding protein
VSLRPAGSPGMRIDLCDVSVSLGRGRDARCILKNLSLSLLPSQFTIIIGPNGAGKTTLLRTVAGLLPATGRILIGGRELARCSRAERGRVMSYLAQGGRIHWPLSVRDVVSIGRLAFGGVVQKLNDADCRIVERAMIACGIDHLALRPATALSGGEKARVLLARAFAVQAPILLADEPAASLDPAHQIAIMAMLQQEAVAGRTVVAVLHDLSLAVQYATRIIVLDAGAVVEDGPPEEVFNGPALDRVFGVRLLRASVDGRLIVAPAERHPAAGL